MKKVALLFAVLYCLHSTLFAQSKLQGTVTDTMPQQKIAQATVMLLQAKDSILVQFTRTNAAGHFQFTNIDTGRYLLLIAYARYADYTENIHISSLSPQQDLGNVSLITKAKLLREVVIRHAVAAIRIKGDTTEFAADSFRLPPNASVEELLKRLPGIQVDKDGKIAAQGETVRKVLVDGEEFFGDDPTLVTRNLRADMIDKVQLYDKKSDLAVATGINDGIKDKTINLKLKENSKNGQFGKIITGGGLHGYFENQAMINIFRHKKKFSAFGNLSNTGKIGLAGTDNDKYSVGRDESITKDNELDTWDGNYNGQGIPLAQSGGIHYSDQWQEDKQSTNLNYKIANLDVEGESKTRSQNNLPGQIIYSNSTQQFKHTALKNKLIGEYQVKTDSTTLFKLNVVGYLNHKKTADNFSTQTNQQDSSLLNAGTRQLTNTSNQGGMNTNLLIEKKLKRPGRVLSLNLHENYLRENSDGYLLSHTDLYHAGLADSVQDIDQYKTNRSHALYLDGKLVYTTPLSHTLLMAVNYGLFVNSSDAELQTFNKAADQHYSQQDSLYSSHYQYDQLIQQSGVMFTYGKKKIHFTVGTDVGFTNFRQQNLFTGTTVKRNFLNWYPSAEFAYVFKMQKSLSIYYNGNTTMPSVNQIQPVVNNNDPLNIFIGNPWLDPVYTNTVGIRYNNYQPANEKYLFSNFNYAFSGNQITTNTITDATGKNTYQYVNVGGNNRYWGYLGIGQKIAALNGHAGINLGVNGEQSANFSNGQKNILHKNSYSIELYANQYRADAYDIGLKTNATWNTNVSSLQKQDPVNYWTFSINPDGNVFLPGKTQLHTDLNYLIRQRTTAFPDNLNVLLWNAWIGKKLLANDALLLKLSVYDLLNQNKGFNRFVSGNFIVQNSYTTVQRVFMASATWNF